VIILRISVDGNQQETSKESWVLSDSADENCADILHGFYRDENPIL
jgi:hypothetical protein